MNVGRYGPANGTCPGAAMRHGLAALTTLALTALTLAAPASASASRTVGRLAGGSRIETAVSVAEQAFGGHADEVFLARADLPADALAAGALTAGPVLLVPRCGDVPAVVADAIAHLSPFRVTALGGTAAVCDAMLDAAADGRPTDRLAGADRIGTSVAIARRQFPDGAARVYLASAADGAPDAVVAGTLTGGPILLVPGDGPLPTVVRDEIARLSPGQVVAVGGSAAISNDVLATAADGRPARRLAGDSRFATAAAVARDAFPNGASHVYLARADVFADAMVAGALTGGPILLVPHCGAVPAAVRSAIDALAPTSVVALGGERAVCSLVRDRAADLSPPPLATIPPSGVADITDAILATEGMTRAGDTPGWVESLASLQQLAYRQLVHHPEWRDAVYAALPDDLRAIAKANVELGADLSSMVTRYKDAPPSDWRIVMPAPPDELMGYYLEGQRRYGVRWEYLAAVHLVETRMSRIEGTSSAGAQGPMQFMPSTWDAYGEGDIHDDHDAIVAAARYLHAHGAPGDMDSALYAYNHHPAYVRAVTRYAQQMMAGGENVYRTYHGWRVWYHTTQRDVLLEEQNRSS